MPQADGHRPYKGRERTGSVRLRAGYRLFYVLLRIGLADDGSPLEILIIKARTKSCCKKPGNIILSKHPGNRQRQFAVEIDVKKHKREALVLRDLQGSGQIEGKF